MLSLIFKIKIKIKIEIVSFNNLTFTIMKEYLRNIIFLKNKNGYEWFVTIFLKNMTLSVSLKEYSGCSVVVDSMTWFHRGIMAEDVYLMLNVQFKETSNEPIMDHCQSQATKDNFRKEIFCPPPPPTSPISEQQQQQVSCFVGLF